MAKTKEKKVETPTKPTASTAPTQKKGGFPILLVIIGVLCILCAGTTVVGVIIINRVKRNTGGTFQDAVKNITKNGIEKAIENKIEDETGKDANFSLDGDLPSNFPSDIPVYSGAKVGLSSSSESNGEKTVWVNFTSEDSAKNINEYYDSKLQDEGWEIISRTQFLGYSISAKKGEDRTLAVYVADNEDGTSYITLTSVSK